MTHISRLKQLCHCKERFSCFGLADRLTLPHVQTQSTNAISSTAEQMNYKRICTSNINMMHRFLQVNEQTDKQQ